MAAIVVVIVVNVLISLVCLWVAWQVWNLRRTLAGVADALLSYAESTYSGLHGAPPNIAIGEKGVRQLRRQYAQLEPQLQRLQQILGLLRLGQSLWRQRSQRWPGVKRKISRHNRP